MSMWKVLTALTAQDGTTSASGIFMSWGGGPRSEIQGTVKDPAHAGWIELMKCQLDPYEVDGLPTQMTIVAQAGHPSTAILGAQRGGFRAQTVRIDWVQIEKGKPHVYGRLILRGVRVNNHDRLSPLEISITLTFLSMEERLM